jgi:hypothetical protein
MMTSNFSPVFQITRRYAEFSAAIVGINETFPNELINRLLAQLQTEVENFILRMAAEFPQRKEQLIFLINNYDMMLNVIMVRSERRPHVSVNCCINCSCLVLVLVEAR